MVLRAAGTFLRALGPSAATLFLFTLLLSLGIALTQTTIPVLIHHWFPTQIGFVAALFSDGLIIGEAVAAGVTVSIILPLAGEKRWGIALFFLGWPLIVLFFPFVFVFTPPPTKTNHTVT